MDGLLFLVEASPYQRERQESSERKKLSSLPWNHRRPFSNSIILFEFQWIFLFRKDVRKPRMRISGGERTHGTQQEI